MLRSVGIVFFGSKADNHGGILPAHRARNASGENPAGAARRVRRVLSRIEIPLTGRGTAAGSLIGFRQKRAKRSYCVSLDALSMASLSCS